MKNGNKISFLSWLTSKIRNNKIIKDTNKNTEIKENKDVTLVEKDNLYEEKDNINCKKNICDVQKDESLKTIQESTSIENLDVNEEDNKKNILIKNNFFINLKNSLQKTKKIFSISISNLFMSKKIDDFLFEELEEKMLLADIGIDTTNYIIRKLIDDVSRDELKNAEKVYFLLQKKMYSILYKVDIPLQINTHQPFIILVVGVNGTGKTTTVAKLARKYKLEGKKVMLAAADTFRAAGIEQLQRLGELHQIPVISHSTGTDPAAVIFDAVKAAISRKIDILIIDTAGRLHNKLYLLEELKKIVRVIKKIDLSAPHEILLIIDACNGQNTIQQTEIFHNALNITGIIITKLDGTAKGGIIFSLAHRFVIPIRYIGIGEKIMDLGVFNSQDFIHAIFHQK